MHFAMIKEVQMLHEVNSDLFNEEAESDGSLSTAMIDYFKQSENRELLLSLFLHFSDISNPLKPFKICRIWAAKIIEEFFLQGDKEKQMGIPVQAMNDREKVNWPFSQVGFIEFLVSPLVYASVKVLHPLEPFADQMLINLTTWHKSWLTDTKPPPSEAEQKAVSERLAKLTKQGAALQSCRARR
jgi:hypothetical protein